MGKINEFAEILEEFLNIDPVALSVVDNLPGSLLAAYYPDTRVIKLKKSAEWPDDCFAVAHELRHVWQLDNGWQADGSHKPAISVEEYNLRPEEVDANAFAALVMVDAFHIKPQFNGFPEGVKKKIYERIEEIVAETKPNR